MTNQTFDSRAMGYDAIAESALGVELRARVHTVVSELIGPNIAVADLGCGTGIDATWLAPQVQSVHAVDASGEMTALASLRCAPYANVMVEQHDVASLTLDSPVDVVVANFGVVNCVGGLTDFRSTLAAMLVLGGRAVMVTMARWCPIELSVGLVGRNRSLLTRRRSGTTSEPQYPGLEIHYASASGLAAAFAPTFELEHSEALGVFLPPFEQRRWVEDRPRLRSGLAAVDRRLGRVGARLQVGDHHIAVFRRTL